MSEVKVLAFAGSARKDSFNKKLLKVAAACAQEAGAEVTVIDLKDYSLPVFDQDLESESGYPANAEKLKSLMVAHDAFLISAPEYNSSITPLLKNTLDWVSRPSSKTEPPMIAYKGKVAALLSASPGALGGLRGLPIVRAVLQNNGVLVLSQQFALSKAHEAFDTSGHLVDPKQLTIIQSVVQELLRVTRSLKA